MGTSCGTGLARVLETNTDIQIVGQARDGQQAIDLAERLWTLITFIRIRERRNPDASPESWLTVPKIPDPIMSSILVCCTHLQSGLECDRNRPKEKLCACQR